MLSDDSQEEFGRDFRDIESMPNTPGAVVILEKHPSIELKVKRRV